LFFICHGFVINPTAIVVFDPDQLCLIESPQSSPSKLSFSNKSGFVASIGSENVRDDDHTTVSSREKKFVRQNKRYVRSTRN
jgi:hypothetical protein